MSNIVVFTDGASTVYKDENNNRYGGAGVYFENNIINSINKSFKGPTVTNQRMELMACICAIKAFAKHFGKDSSNYQLTIYSDSMYTITAVF